MKCQTFVSQDVACVKIVEIFVVVHFVAVGKYSLYHGFRGSGP